MKVNLTIDGKTLNGYLGGLEQVDDAECTEILAPDLLNFFPVNNIHPFVLECIKKLRHGGKLIIGGSDLYIVAKMVFLKQLNTKEANELIFGNPERMKCSLVTMEDVVELLKLCGLKITKKRIDGYNMIVEGVRE